MGDEKVSLASLLMASTVVTGINRRPYGLLVAFVGAIKSCTLAFYILRA